MKGAVIVRINITKLSIAMARKKLNYSELSDLSNVSRTTLSYIKNGKSCRPKIAAQIADALGVDVTEIIESGEVG